MNICMSLLRRKPTKMSWLRCPSHSSTGMKMPVGMECLLLQFLPRTTLRWIKVEGTLGKSHFSFTHLFKTFYLQRLHLYCWGSYSQPFLLLLQLHLELPPDHAGLLLSALPLKAQHLAVDHHCTPVSGALRWGHTHAPLIFTPAFSSVIFVTCRGPCLF